MTIRLLIGMFLGALVAAVGGLFLGEYEFDETLPILAGGLLGLIVAEVVVSVGQHRSLPLALMVSAWSAASVYLAGMLDANETEPIKTGAYVSAGLAAVAALARANRWRRRERDERQHFRSDRSASAPARRPPPTEHHADDAGTQVAADEVEVDGAAVEVDGAEVHAESDDDTVWQPRPTPAPVPETPEPGPDSDQLRRRDAPLRAPRGPAARPARRAVVRVTARRRPGTRRGR